MGEPPVVPAPASTASPESCSRPRVEGERELEILAATLDVLVDVGYDRLTMDAVAAAARASKATLYRRWRSKASLVVDALVSQKATHVDVDAGSLREDLLGTFCGLGGLTDPRQLGILGAVITAMTRDEEFASAFRRDVIAPRHAATRTIFERARDRGEIRSDADLDALSGALPGTVFHRIFVLGEQPGPDLVAEVVDQVVLPAAHGHSSALLDRSAQSSPSDPTRKATP